MERNIWNYFLENFDEAEQFAAFLLDKLMKSSGLEFEWHLEKTRDTNHYDPENLDVLYRSYYWNGGAPVFFSEKRMKEFQQTLISQDEEHLLYKGHFSRLSDSIEGRGKKTYDSALPKMFYFAKDGIHFQKTDVFKLHGIDWKEELKAWIHARRGEFLIKDLGLE